MPSAQYNSQSNQKLHNITFRHLSHHNRITCICVAHTESHPPSITLNGQSVGICLHSFTVKEGHVSTTFDWLLEIFTVNTICAH